MLCLNGSRLSCVLWPSAEQAVVVMDLRGRGDSVSDSVQSQSSLIKAPGELRDETL